MFPRSSALEASHRSIAVSIDANQTRYEIEEGVLSKTERTPINSVKAWDRLSYGRKALKMHTCLTKPHVVE